MNAWDEARRDLEEWRAVGVPQPAPDAIADSLVWKLLGGLMALGSVALVVMLAVWLSHTLGPVWFALMGAPK